MNPKRFGLKIRQGSAGILSPATLLLCSSPEIRPAAWTGDTAPAAAPW
ncbi:MAG: hypothetical protein AAF597_20200 [Bacteroidota bacterium]